MRTDDTERPLARRAALLGALGLGAGLAGLAAAPDADATTGTMHYGASNDAGTSPTSLTSTAGVTLAAGNTASGVAMSATAAGHDAVQATTNADSKSGLYAQDHSPNGGYGVYGTSDHGTGVYGHGGYAGVIASGDTAGVWADSSSGSAFYASVSGAAGVLTGNAVDQVAVNVQSSGNDCLNAVTLADGHIAVKASDGSATGGTGLHAESPHGVAIEAHAGVDTLSVATALHATTVNGTAVSAEADNGNAIVARAQNGTGISVDATNGGAISVVSNGGQGISVDCTGNHGVYVQTGGGPVIAVAALDLSDAGGTGVFAHSPHGTALAVDGPAQFDGTTTFARSGVATIRTNGTSVVVATAAVTASSMVLAALQNHRPGIHVEAVVPNVKTGEFTIFVSGAVPSATKVAWFVLG